MKALGTIKLLLVLVFCLPFSGAFTVYYYVSALR
jgi:hypothetical protein